jgi:hypothetical protein
MNRIKLHDSYNPSVVLSTSSHRDEYDFLFSRKSSDQPSSIVTSALNSIKDVGSGFLEIIMGNPDSDPAKLGELQRVSTQYAAGFQSSLGLAKVFTGDIYSGTYNMLLGVLGVSCSREGKSKDMLKTYVVITFINGCVQAMEVLQMSLAGVPMFGTGVPFVVKAGHAISLLNPCASFIGAYLGWQFVKAAKQQYLLALAHYQLQMLMMHQQQQMMQAAMMQQQAMVAGNSMKRLPPIAEDTEISLVSEATGGSHDEKVEKDFEDGGSVG